MTTVSFTTQVPEVGADSDQIQEWVEWCLSMRGGCSLDNPLCDYDLENSSNVSIS